MPERPGSSVQTGTATARQGSPNPTDGGRQAPVLNGVGFFSKARLTLDDVMESARASGLERLDQIRYAIIERNGKISIIQRPDEKGA